MRATTWEKMTPEEQQQEIEDCRRADELEAKERAAGYTSDSDYDRMGY